MWWKDQVGNGTYALAGGLVESSGFEWTNISDWRDYTEFKWLGTAASNATVVQSAIRVVSSFIMWFSSITDGGTYTLSAELSTPGGGFTTLATMVVPANSLVPLISTFTPATIPSGCKLKITRTTAGVSHTIRCIFAGTDLTMQRGMFKGVRPPALSGSIVSDTVIAVNGSILGRNIRRVDRAQSLEINPVTASWVRSEWEPFVVHMERFAAFYQWNSVTYPEDVAFAGAEQIVAPENGDPVPYMKVSMPLRLLR
jgi:hypothetical protein